MKKNRLLAVLLAVATPALAADQVIEVKVANATETITVPDAFVARLIAWVDAQPALLEDSGEVDENGQPILEEVEETSAEKLARLLAEDTRRRLRIAVRDFERRSAVEAIELIPVE